MLVIRKHIQTSDVSWVQQLLVGLDNADARIWQFFERFRQTGGYSYKFETEKISMQAARCTTTSRPGTIWG